MNTYFSLVTDLESLIEKFNAILSGSDSEVVNINGTSKDSVSKAIKEKINVLTQEIDKGVIAFETFSLLNGFTPSVSQLNSSFKVTNDPTTDLNGYYIYSGEEYKKEHSLVTDLLSESLTSDSISSSSVWREFGKFLNTGFYPIQPKASPNPSRNQNIDFRGSIVDADLRAINSAGDYDDSLYYSFAEISGDKNSYLFKLYSSTSPLGGNWKLITIFTSNDAINLPESGYSPEISNVLHLEKKYGDDFCYLSFIPSKLPHDGAHTTINWQNGGLMKEAFIEDPMEITSIPRRIRNAIASHVDESDTTRAPSGNAVHTAISKAVKPSIYQENTIEVSQSRNWKDIIVGLDLSELRTYGTDQYSSGENQYGDTLYWSFAESSFTDYSFYFTLYASKNKTGGSWESLPFRVSFSLSNLMTGQTYSRDTLEKLHLRAFFIGNDGERRCIYATIRPGLFSDNDGYIGSINWNEAGLKDSVWVQGESLYDYSNIFISSDNFINSKQSRIVTPISESGDSFADEIREAFVECQITGNRKEDSSYGPRTIRINDDGAYFEFYQRELGDNEGWVSKGNPESIFIPAGSMDSNNWLYFEKQGTEWGFKLYIDPSKLPKSLYTSANKEIYFNDECWNPIQSFLINQRNTSIQSESTKPRITLPKTLYAMVGFDFRLYYDAITLYHEVGNGDLPALIDISSSIGKMDRRSFFINANESQVGEHSITVTIFNNEGEVLETANSIIKVIEKENPSKSTNLVSIGDSTTDDTGAVTKVMQENFESIGGLTPNFLGTRGFYPGNHEARTGKTFSYFANGQRAYKFNVTGVNDVDSSWYPLRSYYGPDGTGYILMNQEISINQDGTGYLIADIWRWPDSGALPEGWSGVLNRRTGNGPENITVTSLEYVEPFSPFIDYGGSGKIDFQYYASKNGYETIDVLAIDLGINDMRGSLKSKGEIDAVVDNAKKIIDAFLLYNPSGWIVLGLPKSSCSTLFKSTISTYRINIHTLRESLIKEFDSGIYHPQIVLCPAGMMIDRYYGYPRSVKGSSKYYPDANIEQHTDDVHPLEEGYFEMAESRVHALSYALRQV